MGSICTRPTRPIENRPQVENLPHKFCSIPNTGKSMRHWAVSLRRTQRWKGTPSTRLPTSLPKPPPRFPGNSPCASLPCRPPRPKHAGSVYTESDLEVENAHSPLITDPRTDRHHEHLPSEARYRVTGYRTAGDRETTSEIPVARVLECRYGASSPITPPTDRTAKPLRGCSTLE